MRIVTVIILIVAAVMLVMPPVTCKSGPGKTCGETMLITLDVCHAGTGMISNADSGPYIIQGQFLIAENAVFQDHKSITPAFYYDIVVPSLERPPQV